MPRPRETDPFLKKIPQRKAKLRHENFDVENVDCQPSIIAFAEQLLNQFPFLQCYIVDQEGSYKLKLFYIKGFAASQELKERYSKGESRLFCSWNQEYSEPPIPASSIDHSGSLHSKMTNWVVHGCPRKLRKTLNRSIMFVCAEGGWPDHITIQLTSAADSTRTV